MSTATNVCALFEEQVKKNPQELAVLFNQDSLTYEQLNCKANQLAHYLLAKNIQPDIPVAFCLNRSFECLITILAILKAGAAYLPLDATYPKERLLYVLKDSNTPLLITHSTLKGPFLSFKKKCLFIDKTWKKIKKYPTSNPNLNIKPRQLAYVIYTSGSTGMPKGVLIEHPSVVNYCSWFAQYTQITKNQRVDFSSNHTFDMAITTTLVPLMLGLTVVICEEKIKKNLSLYLQYLKELEINLIKITPSFFKYLIQEASHHPIDLPQLNRVILGGENLLTKDCESWLRLYPKQHLYNEYGPTEATVGVTQQLVTLSTLPSSLNIPIGQVGTNMQAIIFDKDNNPLPQGQVGELYIGGSCLARGYLNQVELTQDSFINLSEKKTLRFYKTGDLCRFNEQGLLEYLGRKDDQVKIRGFRIEQGEIEKHLNSHPAIQTAIIITRKNTLDEDCLFAYYILKDAHNHPSQNQFRQYLQQFVPAFMIPSFFIKVTSFPLTANGKLDKAQLPQAHEHVDSNCQQPSTELEKKLAQIWSEELGVPIIGLQHDFFELGGHSLSAARIISKINRLMNTELDLKDLYETPNIAQLSLLLSKSKKIGKPPAFNPSSTSSFIPLSDFQLLLWLSVTFKPKAKKLNIAARKRLQGRPDKAALEFAFNSVLKQQEVLHYQISSLKPVQLLQKKLPFKIQEIDLQHLNINESNLLLKQSYEELMKVYPWPKNSPLLLAKLFYLKNNKTELQITIPHLISDDSSSEILLAALSQFYLFYKTKEAPPFKPRAPFKKYIVNEQQYLNQFLERDFHFWNNYLENTYLFAFPQHLIVKNMRLKKIPYSTFTKIPEVKLNAFKEFCSHRHINVYEGLCALVIMALKPYSKEGNAHKPYIYINRVQSTRTNEIFDRTVGCFLRLAPIRVALNKVNSLDKLIEDIHESIIHTSPYQQCSDLIKLASLGTFQDKKNTLKQFFLNILVSMYTSLFSFSAINRKIFKLCINRLATVKLHRNFLININVHHQFRADNRENYNLFGLDTEPLNFHQYDLLNIDNVFDLCFIRENGSAYLVISANLDPNFRKQIAQDIIRIMNSIPLKEKIDMEELK